MSGASNMNSGPMGEVRVAASRRPKRNRYQGNPGMNRLLAVGLIASAFLAGAPPIRAAPLGDAAKVGARLTRLIV